MSDYVPTFPQAYPSWENFLAISFLSDKQKAAYAHILHQRFQRLFQ